MPFSWTIDSFTDANGQAKSVVGLIHKAINQRMVAAGEEAMPDLVAGTTVVHSCSGTKPDANNRHMRWRFYQKWCEDNCGKFVRCLDDAGDPLDLDGETKIGKWTWSDMKALVLPYGDWRAKTIAAGVVTTSLRKAEEGDVYGPWLMEDLRKVLNALIWTAYRVTLSIPYGAVSKTAAHSAFTGDYAAAKAQALSEWNANEGSPYQAQAYYYAAYTVATGKYGWFVVRGCSVGSVEGIPAGCAKTVGFYVHAVNNVNDVPDQTGVDEFDAQGDVVVENQWKLWESTDLAADVTGCVGTVQLSSGGTAMPDAPAADPNTVENTTHAMSYRFRGWKRASAALGQLPDSVLDATLPGGVKSATVAIAKWNFSEK